MTFVNTRVCLLQYGPLHTCRLHFLINLVPALLGKSGVGLHGRVVKGVGHLGNGEAMEAGGREFDLRGTIVG